MKPRIAVMDCETDPFEYGSTIEPFVIGFYDGYSRYHFWGKDCREQFVNHIATLDRPYMIFVHNGGKFDMMFMLSFLENDLHIQNGRIVQCHIGKHEFRDSYSILPIPLRSFKGKHQKQEWTDRDYKEHMHKDRREKYKRIILEYLDDDLLTLYDGVQEFRAEFGDKLTIGSTSMKQLKDFHKFESGGQRYDEQFRPYYFGGRNQCFRSGIIEGPYKIFDVNSMYPYVMREFKHPISTAYDINIKITPRTTFALIEAKNYGCLPIRTKNGLDFTTERGIFHASIHEIEAGLETRTLQILSIKHTIEHKTVANFAAFVDHFYAKRLEAKANGRDMLVTFYKLILNSAYGKFAQNPANYKEYAITQGRIIDGVCEPYCPPECEYHWRLSSTNGDYFIWEKPTNTKIFFNVATAASITAAARAVLLRGLARATDPIYCDTDSIIARHINVEIHPLKLGAWKPEGSGSLAAIAGKKLYAIFDGDQCIKHACKGVSITPFDIVQIAKGSIVATQNPVPHFKFDGHVGYVSRRVRATASTKPPKGVGDPLWKPPKPRSQSTASRANVSPK